MVRPALPRVVAGVAAVLLVAGWFAADRFPTPGSATSFRVTTYAGVLAAGIALALVVDAVVATASRTGIRVTALALVGLGAVTLGTLLLDLRGVDDASKVVTMALAAALMVRAIERPWWLIPVCISVAVADSWSVFSDSGVTNAIIDRAEESPRWMTWPTIAIPVPGFGYEESMRLGVVDVFFAGVFVGCARRWSLAPRLVVLACGAAILATLVVGIELADGRPLPALPFLSAAFLVATMVHLVRDARLARRGEPPSCSQDRTPVPYGE